MNTINKTIERALAGERNIRITLSSLSPEDRGTADLINLLLESYEKLYRERGIYRNGLRETLDIFEKRLDSLSVVRRIGELSMTAKTVDEVCEIAVRAFRDDLDFENCSIMLLDEKGEYLELKAVSGWGDMLNGGTAKKRLKIGEGIAGTAAVNREPIFISDVRKDIRFKELPTHVRIGTILCLPLFSNEELIGVINLSHPDTDAIKMEHAGMFLTLSHIVGHLIIKARLYGELIQLKDSLEQRIEEKTIQLKKKTEEAESANRLKTEFLANISHELRTPMTSIIGFSKLLVESKDITGEEKGFVKIIIEEAVRLNQLIGDLLDTAKIESGRLDLKLAEDDINRIIEATAASLQPQISERGHKIKIILDKKVQPVTMDNKRIAEVLWNLMSNAVKYTAHGGEITITSEDKGEEIHVGVSDTGIGIEEKDFGIIFDRFQQVEGSVRREYGGVGLGLNIAKYIVEVHGGKIWVESEFGKGSVFTFSIPKKIKGARVMGQEEQGQESRGKGQDKNILTPYPLHLTAANASCTSYYDYLEGKKIFIIEDDEKIALLIKEMLEREGLITAHFLSGEDALKGTEKEPSDLILLDIVMQGMNGYEVLKVLKGNDKTKNIPVIMLTAKAEIADRVNGLKEGAADYILKPFEPDELIARINTQLRIKSMESELVRAKRNELWNQTAITLSHEINNPLTIIIGEAERILDEVKTGERHVKDLEDYANNIIEASERIRDLVLRISKITDPVPITYHGEIKMIDTGR